MEEQDANMTEQDMQDIRTAVLQGEGEGKTPPVSSGGKETEGDNSHKESEASGDDQTKKSGEGSEGDKTSALEEKLAKIKEIFGDDEEAINEYIKKAGFHKNPAWQARQALIEKLKHENETLKQGKGVLDPETTKLIEEFKQIHSNPDFVRQKMEAQGFRQEVIDTKMKEMGFDVKPKELDPVEIVAKHFNVDFNKIDEQQKTLYMDIINIADVLTKERMKNAFPEQIKPLEEKISSMYQETSANKLMERMQKVIDSEGILDMEKDINPLLDKFAEDNPKATQGEIYQKFIELNHSLALERLKLGKRKEEREDTKGKLRNQSGSSTPSNKQQPPKRLHASATSKDVNGFIEAVMQEQGVS